MSRLRDRLNSNLNYLEEKIGQPIKPLKASTNSKVDSKGRKSSFGILPHVTCPGRTEFCSSCYVTSSYRYKNVPGLLADNTNSLFAIQKNKSLSSDQKIDKMKDLLVEMLKKTKVERLGFFRIHWSGDFFSREYLQAWYQAIKEFPSVSFWTYTRCFHLDFKGKPSNLALYFSADEFNHDTANKVASLYNFPVAYAGKTNATSFTKCEVLSGKAIDCNECQMCMAGRPVFFELHR